MAQTLIPVGHFDALKNISEVQKDDSGVGDLRGVLNTMIGQQLTDDQRAGVAANTPSASNPLISQAEINDYLNQTESSLYPGGFFRALYDFATHGGTVGSHPFGPEFPDNAIISRAWYYVVTTFQSPTGPDNASVGIGFPTDDVGGIVAPITINHGGSPWDAGAFEAIQDGTVTNFSNILTDARQLNLEVGVEAITAGRLYVFGHYFVVE